MAAPWYPLPVYIALPTATHGYSPPPPLWAGDPALIAGSIIALLVFGGVCCGMLMLYVAILRRYPEALTKWVSTFSLVFGHVQMLAVIGNLQLEWPPQVKAVTGLASFSLVSVTVVRSECLVEIANPFVVMSIGQIALMITALTTLLALATNLCCILSPSRQDQIWFTLTIYTQFTFGSSWRIALNLMLHTGATGEFPPGAVASGIMLLQVCYLVYALLLPVVVITAIHFLRGSDARAGTLRTKAHKGGSGVSSCAILAAMRGEQTSAGNTARDLGGCLASFGTWSWDLVVDHSFRRLRLGGLLEGGGNGGRRAQPVSKLRLVGGTFGVTQRSLFHDASRGGPPAARPPHDRDLDLDAAQALLIRYKARVTYLTARYAIHAPYWQFVMWARRAYTRAFNPCHCINTLPSSFDLTFSPHPLNRTPSGHYIIASELALMMDATLAKGIVDRDPAVQRAAVWVQAVIALVVLVGFWRLHSRVLPYEFECAPLYDF